MGWTTTQRSRAAAVLALTLIFGVGSTVPSAYAAGATATGEAQRNAAVSPTSILASTTLDNIRADADWILRSQAPDGAIATYPDLRHLRPYLAHYAAIGLTQATKRTGDQRYVGAAWRWLTWYQAHQDVRGFVTDYDAAADGSWTSLGDEDSTDAYAGMFLVAVRSAYSVSGDLAKLRGLTAGVAAAVAAVEATQQSDGLTWAKPAWKVKYLMDQAEAYAGLRAAASIETALGNGDLSSRAAADARAVRAGVAGLWNADVAAYDWAKHENGARVPTRWANLYSDSLQQPWAVAWSLVGPTRARNLMATFEAHQPRWDRPAEQAVYESSAAAVGYWAPVGWAYLIVGDTARASLAAGRIRSAAMATGRAWPFTPADAGQLIVLEAGDTSLITS